MEEKEISLIDQNISSLLQVPLRPTITSLNLHCNRIPRIEGLSSLWLLRHLDLSSNCIAKIDGLATLTALRTLNLSCNVITKVEGLNGLVNLTRLDLSFNQINDLSGLLHLHGPGRRLKHLSLHSNRLGSIEHLLQCLLGLQGLREVLLSYSGKDNPLCTTPGYREIVMQSLPQVSVLDGLNRLGQPSYYVTDSPCDVPGLENYVDLLLLSDGCHSEADNFVTTLSKRQSVAPEACTNQVAAPDRVRKCIQPSVNEERVKKLEQQVSRLVQQVSAKQKSSQPSDSAVKARKLVNCAECTSETECDSGKENCTRSPIPKSRKAVTIRTSKRSDSDHENPKQRMTKPVIRGSSSLPKGGGDASGSTRRFTLRTGKEPIDVKRKSSEEETYKAILEERDQERERRWKAEQVVTKLTDELKCLKTKVSEEKDLQSMAMHTTDRLKDLLLKERSTRCELERRVEQLDGRCRSLNQQLEQVRGSEERHKHKLRQLEEDIAHGEALQARQQAQEMKQQQELENELTGLKRELDVQRAKVQQLHELLACREQEHRKQLEMRLQPGGMDFQAALAKEVASERQILAQRESELKDKIEKGKKAYAALEDEFRLALTIEAARYTEVKKACDQMSAELPEMRLTLAQSQYMEKKSASQVRELSELVKEQKSRISELQKAKRDTLAEFKRRAQALEDELDQDRRMRLQLDALKKDKARLSSQLGAQESVIDGLRAERKLWGQELAQQGASLAQDRGRLEARIEALGTEVEAQKKQIERDRDSLKIKCKIMEDQTETIRKLKETLQQRDEEVRSLRDNKALAEKTFQRQLKEETSQVSELRDRVERLGLRKEELTQQLEEKEAEIDELIRVHSESSKKWQEKAQLLTQLESQVNRMKESFDSKERALIKEKEQMTDAHRVAMEKLRCMDDAFRTQIESLQAAHEAELLQLENEKHDHIAEANQKVFEVEEEMRQLLFEVDANKRITEEKMKRLNSVLKDFNS
ncbi:leucine-rich repeat and coiled-coil domain-containing protein 1 [Corythoichthys intestinalis]|uniref:leucine-rich repeat and coiled-coil domain-containing protein 1 n=1 Tax=Corythoichthys intestinalis TaxID=161448 RepID=UPI0025A51CF0|nr:leucine-rich repeat and coiled-coil domain-containing protein 1 [Corythoichthys intestinalis]XP_061795008.1 leucine-rich repeat and coiled-coil domain-containing protein 1-like [Nerophis lumbriciformis]